MLEHETGVLAVRFYSRPIENAFRSEQEGRPVSEMRDFVRIEIPGNNLSVIDTFANQDHKDRFPIQWARYMNEKTDGDIQGTLLKDWPILNAAQVNELKHFKFYTVEQVANASDQQLNSIGMLLGMSPLSARDKAKAFISNAKDSAVVQAQADELRKRDEEIAAMKAQIEELIRSQVKRGRKPKDETEDE